MINRFLPIAMGLGLVVSPDTLAMVGQTAGGSGRTLPLFLLAATTVYLVTLKTYSRRLADSPHPAVETALVEKGFPALLRYFPLVARAAAAVTVATSVLVSAGFAFNEVFVYWFPNFAFAFVLLASLAAVNLRAPGAPLRVQPFLVGAVLLGLTILSLWGGVAAGGPDPDAAAAGPPLRWQTAGIPLLIFVGVELAVLNGGRPEDGAGSNFAAAGAAVAGAAVVFSLWGFASLRHVPAERLSGTTIPHIIAAREILGPSGRLLMGGVVIAGACAAVNALFSSVTRMAAAMAEQGLLPRAAGRPWVPVGVLGGGAALLMGSGMAGEESLEAYLRGSLVLWLAAYGLLHLSTVAAPSRHTPPTRGNRARLAAAGHLAMLAVFAAAGLLLTAAHPQPAATAGFAGGVFGCSLLMGWLGRRWQRQ